jgi:integrase/recombinase XerD
LLGYLHDEQVLPPEQVAATPAEELLASYRRYLILERGVAPLTALRYERMARRFLLGRVSRADAQTGAEDLSGAEVIAYLAGCCSRLSTTGSAKREAADLRSLLRFLYLEAKVPVLLVHAVVSPAAWRLTGLPRSISAAQAEALVLSCERGAPSGRRDFAILVVLVRLGLRAGEVARLGLDDIDWRQGQILVRGKGRRLDHLPLPADVGEAIVEWLRDGRPRRGAAREVFTRLRAPDGPLTPGAVSAVVRRACQRAGLAPIGAHRLRHTAAVGMLRGGANLGEVGRALRQQRPQTTAMYAKVDLVALAELARPWPGAQS